MKQQRFVICLIWSLLCVSCQAIPLPDTTPEVGDIFLRLSEGQEADNDTLVVDIERLSEILLEVFDGHYEPIPESEIDSYSPLQDFSPLQSYRWGFELPDSPLADDNAGALVARPISASYNTHLPLVVSGPWTEMFLRVYEKFDKTFAAGEAEAFLAGETDTLNATNEVTNLADFGIVFEYSSQSFFRRVREVNVPGGEALIHWETMVGEAVRTAGGNSGYLDFLINMQVCVPLSDTLSWRIAVTWTHAGGSVLFFSGTANSGDIGKGMRRDFEDLESYLAANN